MLMGKIGITFLSHLLSRGFFFFFFYNIDIFSVSYFVEWWLEEHTSLG